MHEKLQFAKITHSKGGGGSAKINPRENLEIGIVKENVKSFLTMDLDLDF